MASTSSKTDQHFEDGSVDVDPSNASQSEAPRPLASLTGIQILGTGSYAPEDVVTNKDLAELGYDEDWIVQRTGIHARCRAPLDQATSDIAYEASRRCIERAGIDVSEIDLILVATMTPDMPAPSTACLLQHRLGASCGAFDMNAACAGFMYALVTGMQFVKTGCARKVLVVGADLMSRVVNPQDKQTFPLFGDGAGAVLLGAGSDQQGLLSYALGSDGSGAKLLCQPTGGTREPITPEVIEADRQYLIMDGRAVFKWAVRQLHDASTKVLREADLSADDIDLVVLHQANIRIIDAAVDDLGIDPKKVYTNLHRYGNTSAASMPLVLDEAFAEGRIKSGDHILLCGFGAGLAWGAAVLKW